MNTTVTLEQSLTEIEVTEIVSELHLTQAVTEVTLVNGEVFELVSGMIVDSSAYYDQAFNAAKSYSDTQDGITLSSANAYSDSQDALVLQASNDYADLGDANTLNSANSYSDAGNSSTLTAANTYSDAGDTDTLNAANTYTDGQVTTINTSLSNKADLVAGLVPASQLPSYVDDVLEFPNLASFPVTGESGKIYVDLSTNLTYRWGGSSYAPLDPSLALGETISTAYRGDRGKTAFDHSQETGNPHNTAIGDITGLQTALNSKEPNIILGTTDQYWRGDKTFVDFMTDVRATLATGISFATSTAAVATDTFLVILGKLQAQISSIISGYASKSITNLFTKNQTVMPVTLTSATTVTSNAADSNTFKLTVGHNLTLDKPSNLSDGMVLTFMVKINGTGGYTWAFHADFVPIGGTPTAPNATANKYSIIVAAYDSSTTKLYYTIAKEA